jgi:hypothetical protein
MEPPPNSSFNVHCLFLLIPATVLVSVDLGPRCPKSNAEGPCICQTVVTWAQTKHSATAPCSLDGRSGHGTKMSQHVRRVSLPWGVRARRSGHRHAGAAPGASFCSTPGASFCSTPATAKTDAENPVLICRAQSQRQLCGCHRSAAAPVSEELGVVWITNCMR